MTCTPENIAALAPEMPPEQIAAHFSLWGERYSEVFSPEEILSHIQNLGTLNETTLCAVMVTHDPEGRIECTVLAFDTPAIFSVITGLLGATGLNILSGDIFTSSRPPLSPAYRRRRRTRTSYVSVDRRRRIIDRFKGHLNIPEDWSLDRWQSEFLSVLREATRLLENNSSDGSLLARRFVYERVAEQMNRQTHSLLPALYPVKIEVDNSDAWTRLTVYSQDTPFFLYSLCNALALREISIEQVRIETTEGQVADVIDVLDRHNQKILDPSQIDELRFSVLLTKQFTYFLGQAPNPYQALRRFEQLTEDIFHDPDRKTWLEQFSNPASLQDLARLLGASDFLWEDFIRTQHEALLPVLGISADTRRHILDAAERDQRLDALLSEATTFEEQCVALNQWKDQEIFRIDLAHILDPKMAVRGLAEHLTAIAEHVVDNATRIVYEHMVKKYGIPRTVGGFVTPFAVFGLGKLGGVALGYASDIELLFVYADQGHTDGREKLANSEFFDKLVQEISHAIVARREGVFQIDLRLRPYGTSGPMACSLESFCRYYGPAGDALSYERLALVRLRSVSGDRDLGKRIERLRDEFVYESGAISFPELHELRAKQASTKVGSTGYNAKFSPGALVDIEYCVQMLQTVHGGKYQKLRTPRIHLALEALLEAGVIESAECSRLNDAYYFLRRLINALRMLRGNALDLFLPETHSLEFKHLARRMGYRLQGNLDAGTQLFVDFETQTAVVRRFVEHHFGSENIPGSGTGNVVDVLLSNTPDPTLVRAALEKMGLSNVERGLRNFQSLMSAADKPSTFCRLAVLAGDMLSLTADPDMALNNWDRFIADHPAPEKHFRDILLQPRRLEILLGVLATSQFLAETLIRYPDFMDCVTDPKVLNHDFNTAGMLTELDRFAAAREDSCDWELAVRRFRRREILRIGIRDLFLRVPITSVTQDLSALAEAILVRTVENVYRELLAKDTGEAPPLESFSLIALGKLGGNELNYSSDIDLIGVYDSKVEDTYDPKQFFPKLLDGIRASLMKHTADGYVYRVDFRLRPYGRSGPLVNSETSLMRYYQRDAAMWEKQALIKARTVAGNTDFGSDLLTALKGIFQASMECDKIVSSIRHMRQTAVQTHVQEGVVDVKNGVGGIRDIEFLVQALQMQYAAEYPTLVTGNTIHAIAALEELRILSDVECELLRDHYAFLRRVEHFLQLFDDRQLHALPRDPIQLGRLAKRVLSPDKTADDISKLVHTAMTDARRSFNHHLDDTAGQ